MGERLYEDDWVRVRFSGSHLQLQQVISVHAGVVLTRTGQCHKLRDVELVKS